ncbi:MAG: hypothetical protein ABUK01_14895 [Leptospirales bacterium]
MENKSQYYVPSKRATRVGKRLIGLIKSGKIKKEVLPNTSNAFNADKVAKSIDGLSTNPDLLSIANQ